ncbi:hypothetical protein [Streptomyces sp. NPDC093568]|uniref:hypothetical protein n=1 Tax=Streptomyces sp. NPDC093568 TaxID=3366041 RepID=UPI00381EB41C
MTRSATMPGAAVRVLRIAAGRRALRLALVLGGLFAIGLLCGERAYAADGVSVEAPSGSAVPVASTVSSRLLTVPDRPAPSADPGIPATDDTAAQDRPRQDAAPQVEEPQHQEPQHQEPQHREPQYQAPQPAPQFVQPVDEVVRTVSEGLVEGLAQVQAKVPPLTAAPALPTAPGLPAFPNLPGLPDLPSADLPSADLPALPGHTLPAPVTGTPQPGSASAPDGTSPTDGHGDKGRTGTVDARSHGPRYITDVTAAHSPAVGHKHRTSPTRYAPGGQAPTEHPGGAVGGHAAGDSGTPRHGDAHAVSLNRRVSWGLVAGAAVRADADEIKDRHRDIPVSPA